MSADACKTATVKEGLTVQIWDIDGKSVVKDSLTTDSSPLANLDQRQLATCKRRLQVRIDTLRTAMAKLTRCSQKK